MTFLLAVPGFIEVLRLQESKNQTYDEACND
jgi:hypothetical protein